MAHTEVYGYGFRPYEFSSLSHGTVGGAAGNVSLYRQRELELGMHGMRSALYPTFYVIVSCVADIVSLDVRPFVVRYVQNGSVCVVCLFWFILLFLFLFSYVCACACVRACVRRARACVCICLSQPLTEVSFFLFNTKKGLVFVCEESCVSCRLYSYYTDRNTTQTELPLSTEPSEATTTTTSLFTITVF